MKLVRPLTTKNWSAGNLALAIVAGVLSVWLLGALASGFGSGLGGPNSAGPSPRSASSRSLSLGQPDITSPSFAAPSPVKALTPVNSSGFSIKCDGPQGVAGQSRGSLNCRVNSVAGFAGTVSLTCANLPKGLDCEPVPAMVTVVPNGSGEFKLSLAGNSTPPGSYIFKLIGTSKGLSSSLSLPFESSGENSGLQPSKVPGVDIDCQTGSTGLIPGQTISYKCTYSSELFYDSLVTGCTGTPGIACDISPRTVTPRDGQPAEATLTLTVAANLSSAGRDQVIAVYGDSASLPAGTPRPVTKFTVDIPEPEFALACLTKAARVEPGGKAEIACRVSSPTGYVGPLYLKIVSVDPGGPQASAAPAAVQVGAGRAVGSSVTFTADGSVKAGTYRYALGVSAEDRSVPVPAAADTSRQVNLTVTVAAPPVSQPDAGPSPQG